MHMGCTMPLCTSVGDKHAPSHPWVKHCCAACLAHSTEHTLSAYFNAACKSMQDPGNKITVWHRATQHGNVCPAEQVGESCQVLLPCAAGTPNDRHPWKALGTHADAACVLASAVHVLDMPQQYHITSRYHMHSLPDRTRPKSPCPVPVLWQEQPDMHLCPTGLAHPSCAQTY